ncbi:MAG: AraC family transcriptional regulator [Lachnospiraceae bacterium]|nr:AraC family transcriptional regulator [Lachnospiraceae bacterium]
MRDPVQPFFTLSSDKYYKKVMDGSDIAHFYEYTCRPKELSYIAIPDVSVDVIFDLTGNDLYSYAAGTVLTGRNIRYDNDHRYFGVRFKPGRVPAFCDTKFSDLIGENIEFSLMCRDRFLPEKLAELPDFGARIDFFTKYYNDISFEHEDTVLDILQKKILECDGNIAIEDLASYSGYTRRYIDRLFKDSVGISPKTYAQIVCFQSTINELDKDSSKSLADVAIDHGYTDQAHFTHAFSKYALMAPGKYRKLILRSAYTDRFVLL